MAKNSSNFPSKQSIKDPDYSTFDCSHVHRTTLDMGKLIPIFNEAVLAGDKFEFDISHFVRTMPTIVPIMDNVDLKFNAFFVPYRILWDYFPDWLTGNDTHKLTGDPKPVIPKWRMSNPNQLGKYPNGRLADYLGVPSFNNQTSVDVNFSLFPFLAYQKIFLDWYAPQRWVEYANQAGSDTTYFWLKKYLQQIKKSPVTAPNIFLPNGLGFTKELFNLRTVNTNNDYFTNALPTPNLYNEVRIPFWNKDNDAFLIATDPHVQGVSEFRPDDYDGNLHLYNSEKLATITQLRENIALQHFLEAMQVGGGRYMETMKVIWGQDIPDATLQRSEYIGGDIAPIFFNEVESNAITDNGTLGDVGGKPVSAGKTKKLSFKADEHGIFLVLAHVVPKRSYTDVVDKKLWMLTEPTDIPNKHFEGIGDQPIYDYELTGRFSEDPSIFGYVPRYFDWKGSIDKFSGEMRHSLMHWHLGLPSNYFNSSTLRTIGPEFLKCNPRTDIFNIPEEDDKVFGVFQIDLKVSRGLSHNPMPGVTYI